MVWFSSLLLLLAACNGYSSGVDSEYADVDQDGWSPAEGDCDDHDINRYPQDLEESCHDEVDNDCDDLVDSADPDCNR